MNPPEAQGHVDPLLFFDDYLKAKSSTNHDVFAQATAGKTDRPGSPGQYPYGAKYRHRAHSE